MNRIHAAASRFLAIAPLLVLLYAGGCGEPYSAGTDFKITNEVNIFRFQLSDMKNYSQTFTYTWSHSGTAGAVVDQFSTISGGDATLVLKDSAGTTVYTRSMKQNGKFLTDAGSPGFWTVQLLMNKVSGSVAMQAAPN